MPRWTAPPDPLPLASGRPAQTHMAETVGLMSLWLQLRLVIAGVSRYGVLGVARLPAYYLSAEITIAANSGCCFPSSADPARQ